MPIAVYGFYIELGYKVFNSIKICQLIGFQDITDLANKYNKSVATFTTSIYRIYFKICCGVL